MAAFPYQQQQPFHLDSLFLSNTAFKMFDLLPERVYTNPNNNNNPTLFPSFQSDSNGCYQEIINEYCLSEKTKSNTDSSSIVDSEGSDQEKIITTTTTTTTSSSMEKKRKHRDGSCMNSTTLDQIKQDGDRAKTTKKQRKINVEKLELTKYKKCNKDDKRKKKNNNSKAIKDLPTTTGYVHVRARRGQATDSHSLAERVRREKISERLKMLQDLVPGCDKVNSKAVMLEEIINYVQSLQHQVEMLSLKLASMNPMVYDFGVDLDAFLVKPEDKLSTLGSPTSFQHLSSIPIASTTFANGTNNNVPLLDSSSSVSFSHQQDQRLSDYLTHSQGHEDLLWHVGYQRQGFINQLGATNWCSFQ